MHVSVAGLVEEFERLLGARWNALMRETGEFLLAKRKIATEPIFDSFRKRLKDTYNISYAQQTVFMRVANGEIDISIATRAPASKLAKISNDKMPQPDDVFTFYSPENGIPVTKSIGEFTSADFNATLTKHGIQQVSDTTEAKEDKPYRDLKWTNFRVEGDELVCVSVLERVEMRGKISQELIEAIAKSQLATA